MKTLHKHDGSWLPQVGGAFGVALIAGFGFAGAVQADGLSLGLGGANATISLGGNAGAHAAASVAGTQATADVLDGNTVADVCIGNTPCNPNGGGAAGADGTAANVHVGTGGSTGGNAGSGDGTVASVDLGGGGTGGGIGVDVGVGGGGAGTGIDVAVGTPGSGGGNGAGGGATDPAVVPVSQDQSQMPPAQLGRMPCAEDGNSVVYNGYPVVDRNGVLIGWVNDTMLDPGLKITKIHLQTPDKRCVGLSGGSFKLTGTQLMAYIDASALN